MRPQPGSDGRSSEDSSQNASGRRRSLDPLAPIYAHWRLRQPEAMTTTSISSAGRGRHRRNSASSFEALTQQWRNGRRASTDAAASAAAAQAAHAAVLAAPGTMASAVYNSNDNNNSGAMAPSTHANAALAPRPRLSLFGPPSFPPPAEDAAEAYRRHASCPAVTPYLANIQILPGMRQEVPYVPPPEGAFERRKSSAQTLPTLHELNIPDPLVPLDTSFRCRASFHDPASAAAAAAAAAAIAAAAAADPQNRQTLLEKEQQALISREEEDDDDDYDDSCDEDDANGGISESGIVMEENPHVDNGPVSRGMDHASDEVMQDAMEDQSESGSCDQHRYIASNIIGYQPMAHHYPSNVHYSQNNHTTSKSIANKDCVMDDRSEVSEISNDKGFNKMSLRHLLSTSRIC